MSTMIVVCAELLGPGGGGQAQGSALFSLGFHAALV
jgi:hypothetical protein